MMSRSARSDEAGRSVCPTGIRVGSRVQRLERRPANFPEQPPGAKVALSGHLPRLLGRKAVGLQVTCVVPSSGTV